ncbi:MAG: glycosyltransferase [Brevinema sp.]
MTKFSFLIPCYGSETTLESVITEIRQTIHNDDTYEIILVNDCSPDRVQEVIDTLCSRFPNISSITFARNFGKHAALMAGLRIAQGQYICYLDDDGQCPMPDFYKLFAEVQKEAHVSMAFYGKKKQSAFKNFGSILNNLMAQILIGKPKELQLTNFVLMKKFVKDEIINYTGAYPYLDGLLLRTTKNIVPVPVKDRHRFKGQTTFTFQKMLQLWLNGFTSFSIVPLRLATLLGFVCSLIGFFMIIYLSLNKIMNPTIVPEGWTSLIAVIILTGGLNLFMLGIVGEYIGRAFMVLSNTPQYVIEKTHNSHMEEK